MKTISKVVVLLLILSLMCGIFVGCDNGPDENTLVIDAVNLGFGVDWLYAVADGYSKLHPEVKFEINSKPGSDGNAAINGEVESLAGVTDIFCFRPTNYHGLCYQGAVSTQTGNFDCIFADLTDIYTTPYENENGATMLSKMDSRVAEYLKVNGKYYGVNWADDFMGIVRNKNVWDSLGLTEDDVPLTTNQFVALCETVNGKSGSVSPIIYSRSEEYYTSIWHIWMAQYEGTQMMDNFINGLDRMGVVSEALYSYEGQRVALEFINKLLTKNNGKYVYHHKDSDSLSFTDMQSYFLADQALFCVNGSWLEIEMNKDSSNKESYNIDYIKTPVISDMVENLSFYAYGDENWKQYNSLTKSEQADYDAKLVELIKFVDAHPNVGDNTGKPEYATDADVERVRDARHICYARGGEDHTAVVASWSKKIDLAKDFLKYLYSDEGMKIYYKTQCGMKLPAKLSSGDYDALELSTFSKSVNQAMATGYYSNECFAKASKVFCLGGVNPCFYNGCDNFVKEMLNGKTVSQIIADNVGYIASNLTVIQRNMK